MTDWFMEARDILAPLPEIVQDEEPAQPPPIANDNEDVEAALWTSSMEGL